MPIKFGLFLALVFLTAFSSVTAHAQTGRNIDDHLLILDAAKTIDGNIEAEVNGTPYLSKNFTPGEIYFDKKDRTSLDLRYNIYDDWMEYQQNGKTYILDATNRIKKVYLDDLVFVVEEYETKGKTKRGYFTLLDSGKIILLAKKMVVFHERKEVKPLDSGPTPAKYAKGPDTYYYKIGNGKLIKIDNLKKMIANLPEQQEALSQFAKQEKISVKKEAALKRFIQYYNSL